MNTSNSQSLSLYSGSPPSSHDKVLPPLATKFPKWSRGGKLGRENCFQRPFLKSDKSPNSSLQRVKRDTMVNKKSPELGNVGRPEGLMVTPIADPLLRITQLEQNIRFLQEQHQLMLSSLHQEVEQLRHRNRDLQFQLVFAKGGAPLVQSSPSSPEDDTKPKIILSPKQINVTPLQIELLEKEMAELKAALHEAKTKNIYLSAIVEEQRKKLESLESGKQEMHSLNYRSKSSAQNHSERHIDDRGDGPDCDLATKLEEAEKLIRRLRRDNEEHRRELVTIKTNLSKNLGGAGGNRQLGAGGGNHSHRGGGGGSGANGHHRPHSQQSQSQRFPPLHSQSYWHHGQHSQHRSGIEFVSHRHCANGRGGVGGNGGGSGNSSSVVTNGGTRLEKDSQVVGRPAPSLPNLRNNTSNHYTFTNGNGNNNGHNHRRGHYNGNSNHYYRGGKGGGGRGNRDVRETK